MLLLTSTQRTFHQSRPRRPGGGVWRPRTTIHASH